MGQGEDDSDNNKSNFFIRFKNHVDATFSSGVTAITGSAASEPASTSKQPPTSGSSKTDFNPQKSPQPSSSREYTGTMDTIGDGLLNPEAIMSHVAISDYSPMTLRILPQPVPNDIKPHMDRSVMGFEDAFEDLLAVSSGHPLPDISAVYKQRKYLNDRFLAGEPLFLFLRRLRAKGLLYTPSPERYPQNDRRAMLDWLHQETERRVEDDWGPASDLEKHPDPDDISDLMKQTAKTWAWKWKEEDETREKILKAWKQGREPESEGDLIDAIESRFGGGHSTWDTFMKSFNQDFPDKKTQSSKSSDKEDDTVQKKEYVDRFGLRHTSVTKKIFDEDGNQIGTHVSHNVRTANEDDEGKDLQPTEGEENGHKPRKIGWFWGKN